MTAAFHRSDRADPSPPTHSTCFGLLWEKLLRNFCRGSGHSHPHQPHQAGRVRSPHNPRRQEPAGSTFAEAGASLSGASTDWQRPGRTSDRRRPLVSPGGPPRAPAQGHPARGGRGGGAQPDLPAVGGSGDRPRPSHGSACASPRGRGGAGPPGAAAQERALGKGGGSAPEAGPGRGRGGVGPTFRLGARSAGLRLGCLSSQ